jgi:hypothetical protein
MIFPRIAIFSQRLTQYWQNDGLNRQEYPTSGVYFSVMRGYKETRYITQIFVRGSAEPGTLERVLQPFTVSGFVPMRLCLRRNRLNGLFIAARFVDMDIDRASNLAARLRKVPCVQGVRISVRQMAQATAEIGDANRALHAPSNSRMANRSAISSQGYRYEQSCLG